MTAISDTSPLLRFSSIGRLDLLRQLYAEVVIPLVRPLLIELRTAGLYFDDATFNEVMLLVGEGVNERRGG